MARSHSRSFHRLALVLAAASTLVGANALGLQTSAASLTLLSRDGRRALPLSLVSGRDFIALDELASTFQLAVHEEAGALTVSYKGKTIVLTPDQALASVNGRLVSLPAAPVRSGGRLMVPVEFVSRALALIYDQRLDLRTPSRLLIVGALRVPRVSVRYEPAAAGPRLVVEAKPRTLMSVAQQGDRLVLKFDADALDLALGPISGGEDMVRTIHEIDPITLAVELGPKFAAFRTSTETVDAASRTILDLLPHTDTAPAPVAPGVPAPAPTPGATPGPAPPELSPQSAPALRTIVIDPGHGGDDEGVHGPGGAREKDVTLAVARRLKQVIESRLGLRVLLTRGDDRNVALDDRTALANNNKADLFLSLHADGSLRPATSGATVLYAAFDVNAAAAARAGLGSDRLPAFGGGSRQIDLELWDLAQYSHLDRSASLADLVQQQFLGRIPLAVHPIDRAPLRVLESANMPAVLIEMGFLSNPGQEKQLTSAQFQGVLAQAIFDAVLKFRDLPDGARRAPAAGPPPGARGAGGGR
ncbi:MAG: N-acetylmuramoyl-L-alanine amidase [Betaproteobacteria bacterium]